MKKQIIINPDVEEAEKTMQLEIETIKNQLPKRCAFSTISEMIDGKYKPETIKAMFSKRRTMQPVVIEAAKKLIDFVKPKSKNDENV